MAGHDDGVEPFSFRDVRYRPFDPADGVSALDTGSGERRRCRLDTDYLVSKVSKFDREGAGPATKVGDFRRWG